MSLIAHMVEHATYQTSKEMVRFNVHDDWFPWLIKKHWDEMMHFNVTRRLLGECNNEIVMNLVWRNP